MELPILLRELNELDFFQIKGVWYQILIQRRDNFFCQTSSGSVLWLSGLEIVEKFKLSLKNRK